MDRELYQELYRLRQKLKEDGKLSHGRAPLVCSDEALESMAQLRPKKLSDLEGVSGIGEAFIKNYGEEFLALIAKCEASPQAQGIRFSPAVAKTLKELEKKLVSLNRRNRLLYLPKLAPRYALDLYGSGAEVTRRILFGDGKPVTLCELGESGDNNAESIYRQAVQLLREVNKDIRDKGQNDLYIGYPFVIGRLPGEDFSIRAPLALFPVTAERTPVSIRLMPDESRDIIYNDTLLLANFKFNQINRPLPGDTIEEYTEETLFDTLLSYYKEQNLPIRAGEDNALRAFTQYKADEFPKFASGELLLEPCAILGKFPIRSSAIQKDFDEILRKNEINPMLNHLLAGIDELDCYAESKREEAQTTDPSERELIYINDLNSSQEAVLTGIRKTDALVIQGPPGTGKSQTITGLISEYVAGGKTVLMVSEKKTALDVVYSRLGTISKYALLIDDVGNKELFYDQLLKMVALGKTSTQTVELDAVSDRIDAEFQKLEAIAAQLYTPSRLGVEPYRLYQQSEKPNLKNTEQRIAVQRVRQKRSPELLTLAYEQLKQLRRLFSNEATAADIREFLAIEDRHGWMKALRSDLGELDLMNLEQKLSDLQEAISVWKAKSFFGRLFGKGSVNSGVRAILSEYFTSGGENGKLLTEQPEKILEGTREYTTYQELKPLYERLTKQEREYFGSLLALSADRGGDLIAANDELFRTIIFEHIEKFEAESRTKGLFRDIDAFERIIQSIGEAIAQKKELTRQKLALILENSMAQLSLSKRKGEILKALESKRKWSVNKFIKKFDFELFKSVKVWLLTPEVVSEIMPLELGLFDLLIFDEASQMYIEKGVPSLLRAKKAVVSGDHRQLRPSALGFGRTELDPDELSEDEELATALEVESLLDAARFKYPDVMLNFHYRSKYEELIAFSNYAFYKGRLHVSPNAETPARPPIEVHKLDDAQWRDRSNQAEAEYIVKLLKAFFDERKHEETVGIITFNTNQRDLIDDLLDEECAKDADFAAKLRAETARRKDGEDIGFFVKNIESVQGDERDVIIFSIGYAKNESGKLVRNFGWLNQRGGENRLNVAISRAKRKIHIVTSFEPAELQVDDMKNEGPRILKKYLQYCFAVSCGDKEEARRILLSFDEHSAADRSADDGAFEQTIYDRLVTQGYEVERRIGIGGYCIDFAIRRGDSYVLGIECDGSLYRDSTSARERDYHRQKYLEARGWRIHRIWSTDWWHDPQKEIEKIVKIVESRTSPPE